MFELYLPCTLRLIVKACFKNVLGYKSELAIYNNKSSYLIILLSLIDRKM